MSEKREPFFTVPKAAHDAIIGKVEGTNVAFCFAVYAAMRRLANDSRSPDGPLALTINEIAGQAGCSYRKAADVLRVLHSIGAVAITPQGVGGTKFHAPNLYHFPTFGTLCLSIGTDRASNRAETDQIGKEGKEPCADPLSPSVAGKPRKEPTPRQRNPLLDSLAGIDGSDPAQVPPKAWAGIGKELSEIKSVCLDVTPDEIRRRASNYRLHFRDASITPHGLAKWWARCDKPPCAPVASQSEPVRLGSNLKP